MTNTKTRSRRKFTAEFKAKVAMEALQEKLTLSELSKKYEVHPNLITKWKNLLKGLDIDHRNQVWELDISYIPMRRGYMYLFAVIDVYTRYVVGWSLSNTMTAQWCVAVLREAFERHGCPEIVNSDQGSQFTSADYVELMEGNGVAISMDSRGRALDDIFIERLWRSVKQEYVYLSPCETVPGLPCCYSFVNL